MSAGGDGPTDRLAGIEDWILARIAEQIDEPVDKIDAGRPFAEFGMSSRDAVVLVGDLRAHLGRDLSPALLWEYPTARALGDYLRGVTVPAPADDRPTEQPADEPIAVVGVGCRFPGADGPDGFWKMLIDGVDAVGRTADSHTCTT